VAAHEVRLYALGINPDFGWAGRRAEVTVNLPDGGCNAFYDGNINFLAQNQNCNNTGRVADVVYHEYGHGFHRWSMVEGVGSFDGALSEGLSDYMSATMTGDPGTARGFYRGSTQPLRDIAPNHVWPNDVGEIHYTGIIIAGALWDLRVALSNELGDAAGVALADQFFLAVSARATDIPTAYEEVLLEDDDDGNLANGTPNKCLIDEEMGRHGLGPAAPDAPLFTLDHTIPTNPAPGSELHLTVSSGLARPDCTTGSVGSVRVLYTFDDDADLDDFESIELAGNDSGEYDLTLPSATDGTFLRYRLEVLDADGNISGSEPQGSITDPWYGLWIGDYETVFFADFEDDDGDFDHDLISGDAEREGADDWAWGEPGGDAGDPEVAYSGDFIWGNDISPEDNWNGAYQPNVHNVLMAPSIDIEGATEVHIQFRRWLTIEDGFYDTANLRVNGRTIWTQYAAADQDSAGDHHQDLHWAFRSYDVTDLLDATGTLRVEWELLSDGGLQLGGWNIDDFRVIAKFGDSPNGENPGVTDPLAGGAACEECSAVGGSNPTGAWLLLGLLGVVGSRRRRD
jgi:MYXO-CTERM domain-containing protein